MLGPVSREVVLYNDLASPTCPFRCGVTACRANPVRTDLCVTTFRVYTGSQGSNGPSRHFSVLGVPPRVEVGAQTRRRVVKCGTHCYCDRTHWNLDSPFSAGFRHVKEVVLRCHFFVHEDGISFFPVSYFGVPNKIISQELDLRSILPGPFYRTFPYRSFSCKWSVCSSWDEDGASPRVVLPGDQGSFVRRVRTGPVQVAVPVLSHNFYRCRSGTVRKRFLLIASLDFSLM